MAYDPSIYLPQGYRPYQTGPGAPVSQPGWVSGYPYGGMQQPIDALISVTGLEGAKAYQLPPNSKIALFDADADVFYVKTTDAGGFPTVRAFSFAPIEQTPSQGPDAEYVSRAEFDRLAKQVEDMAARSAEKGRADGE